MTALLNEIIALGGSTAHLRPFTQERTRQLYIAPPLGISCTLAEDGGRIVGFQALEWCDPAWTGPDRLPDDWAVIASFVAPDMQGRGIGRALWAVTQAAARDAGVTAIDATIRADNAAGLHYYGGLGFTDYARLRGIPLSDGRPVDRVRKRFDLGRNVR
ncbi:MAG: GNAT family N-acetyltransferase [Paracoccaceae bacterium]